MGNLQPGKLLAIISIFFLLSGCGYRFYGGPARRVFVDSIVNESLQPEIDLYIKRALHDVFISRAVYTPAASEADADFSVSLSINSFSRSPLFYNPAETYDIASARFDIGADLVVRSDGEIILAETLREHISVPLSSGFTEEDLLVESSKRFADRVFIYMLDNI